ncbi:MAG: hypothetical protein ABI718_02100 [Acidobacteriota bacterium]
MTNSDQNPSAQERPPEQDAKPDQSREMLRGMILSLIEELKQGSGDRDKRRQAEDWLKSLAEKYPEFSIRPGLREYYLAEAARLRGDFDAAADLSEKLQLGRMVESFLEKAADLA